MSDFLTDAISLYGTIEHDMRHSKEYLANIKFNYVEVMHKYIFLKVLRGDMSEEISSQKEELVKKKEEIERYRRSIESLSADISRATNTLEDQKQKLSQIKEKEFIIRKRIEEAMNKAQAVSQFAEIKQKNSTYLAQIASCTSEIEQRQVNIQTYKRLVEERNRALVQTNSRKSVADERLKDLQQAANQQMVYLYNWYTQFGSVFMRLVGAKIIDIRKSEQKKLQSIYSSTGEEVPDREEKSSLISIKILAKKKNRTAVITLSFVNGKLDAHTIYKTEDTLQIKPQVCDELFSYCQTTNSTKFFLFESINRQMADNVSSSSVFDQPSRVTHHD
ncbi:hypothetical protein NEHOM01_1065 [Nematocida homosporus]|uniref:uncharacterized protein n=1 Tax=Nematocida homosporus TaxID=1912981 RepID=UPI00221F4849|nr:uncharacterized protein NEHOM01_1065 [Nematocida homosporus]KAI5185788.1 hypothetical protein NEHOM01_1065 [Nematocida homosporus]